MNKTVLNFKKDDNVIKKLKSIDLKKNYWLVLLLIFGVVLLLFGDSIGKEETTQPTQQEDKAVEQLALEYEQRLSSLITQIEGAGRVEVMVTMESTGETVYAKTETEDEQVSNEAGDTNIMSGYSSEYIIVEDENGNKTALIENEYEPIILGVAVLCEGGDKTSVVADITELVKVVMGVASNRVFVGKLVQ